MWGQYKVGHLFANSYSNKGLPYAADFSSQYMNTEFEQSLKTRRLIHLACRKGCSYDNACMKPFNASLKKEETYTKQYRNYEDAQLHLFKYIKG